MQRAKHRLHTHGYNERGFNRKGGAAVLWPTSL